MTQDEVKSVLGEPSGVKNMPPFIWWSYPNNRRVEFAQFSKDTKCRLYFCAIVESNAQAAIQSKSIVCPYCGFEQDIKMASNRYTYELQRQQEYANQQQAHANRQFVSGFFQTVGNSVNSMYEQRIQDSQAYRQQSLDDYTSYVRQRAQTPQSANYHTITYPKIPIVPRYSTAPVISVPSTANTGKLTPSPVGGYIYQGADGTTGKLMPSATGGYLYDDSTGTQGKVTPSGAGGYLYEETRR